MWELGNPHTWQINSDGIVQKKYGAELFLYSRILDRKKLWFETGFDTGFKRGFVCKIQTQIGKQTRVNNEFETWFENWRQTRV